MLDDIMNGLNYLFGDFVLALLITCGVGIIFIGSALIASLREHKSHVRSSKEETK